MSTIEEIAIASYQNNMAFLKQHHNNVHTKLTALEMLLEDGRYQQTYDLEYKEGYFDVIELASNSYLYNQNSIDYSHTLAQSLSFRKDENVLETFYNLNFTAKALEKVKDADALTMHATTAPIIDYHNSYIKKSMHFKNIYKYIFLGLGLGLHLPEILEKSEAKGILLIEDNLELFRLSLFTCNYYELLKDKTVYLSIAQNSDEFHELFSQFYTHSFIWNHYLKFSLFSSLYEEKLKQIQHFILRREERSYPHEMLLYKNTQVLKQLHKGYNFLNLNRRITPLKQFDNTIILGAGPSLHEHIAWLKSQKESYSIIAVFAALKTLAKHNISPDIVIQIDEKVIETERLVNSFDNFDFLEKTNFIFSASVAPILFDTFSKDKTFLIEDRTHYKQSDIYLASASVGESAYAIALLLKCKNIYLLGLDFALDKEGSTHAKDHHLHSTIKETTREDESTISLKDSLVSIKGNFREEVFSTPLLSMSIPIFNVYTQHYKEPFQTVYNLCDGAYLQECIPLHVKSISSLPTEDKSSLSQEINALLCSHSSHTLSANEKEKLLIAHQQVDYYKELLYTFSTSASSNEVFFMQNYTQLLQAILSSTVCELQEIFMLYFLNSSTYVADFFNTKELSNQKKHSKKMKKIVEVQIKKIIEVYERGLSTQEGK